MGDVIRNRNRQWEKHDYLQRAVLFDIYMVYQLREILGSKDLFTNLVDFAMDQFPVNELDNGETGSDEWWEASIEFEKRIHDMEFDVFYQAAMHRLNIKEYLNKNEEE